MLSLSKHLFVILSECNEPKNLPLSFRESVSEPRNLSVISSIVEKSRCFDSRWSLNMTDPSISLRVTQPVISSIVDKYYNLTTQKRTLILRFFFMILHHWLVRPTAYAAIRILNSVITSVTLRAILIYSINSISSAIRT